MICSHIQLSNASERCPDKLTKTSKYSDINVIINCLNNKLEALENEVDALKNKQKVKVNTPIKRDTVSQFTSSHYLVELERCRHESRGLNCIIYITNQKDDQTELQFKADARIYDDKGNEYRAEYMVVGAESAGRRFKKTLLPPKLAVRTQLKFDKVPTDIKSIQILEIYTSIKGRFVGVPLN